MLIDQKLQKKKQNNAKYSFLNKALRGDPHHKKRTFQDNVFYEKKNTFFYSMNICKFSSLEMKPMELGS